MTPPDVLEAMDTIAKYLRAEGYATVVISEGGGATFEYESVLTRQERLYRVIETLHVALEAADKSNAVARSIIAKVKNVDSVFHSIAEWQAAKEQEKKAESASQPGAAEGGAK